MEWTNGQNELLWPVCFIKLKALIKLKTIILKAANLNCLIGIICICFPSSEIRYAQIWTMFSIANNEKY